MQSIWRGARGRVGGNYRPCGRGRLGVGPSVERRFSVKTALVQPS